MTKTGLAQFVEWAEALDKRLTAEKDMPGVFATQRFMLDKAKSLLAEEQAADYRHTPKPAEPVEPLAVLAARKERHYVDINTDSRTKEVMIILQYSKFLETDQKVIFKKSYRAAEQAARAYLSSLPDKMGGK